ncbi:MAG TPA: hypothetical protein PKC45_01790 [Gemmatales bacterium]|nr:hypothetical protein [Gemmatales bacterium]
MKSPGWPRLLSVLLGLALLAGSWSADAAAGRAESTVSAVWSADRCELTGAGGRVRLRGATTLGDGPWPMLLGPGALQRSELLAVGEARQLYERAEVRLSLRLTGEDAALTVRLRNTGGQTLRAFRIGDWAVTCPGAIQAQYRPEPPDQTLASQGPAELWPSWWHRIAATWWATDQAGFAASTRQVGLVRRLWRWRRQGPDHCLGLFICDDIPPGRTATYTLCFRLSARGDWQHLLQPYRADLFAQFGPKQQYVADHRPVIKGLRPAPERITPDNPFGWVTEGTRPHPDADLTTIPGMRYWLDRLVRGCKVHDAQGLIAWGWACWPDADEPWYPYDSWDLPEPVARNVAAIRAGLNSVDRRCGHLIRPGYDYRRGADGRIAFHEPLRFSPEAVRNLQPRFDNTDGLAYLDDFGIGFAQGLGRSAIDDLRLLRAARQAAGTKPQWYAEFPSDVSLFWAGGYERLVQHAEGGLQCYWLNNHLFDVLRWLHPDSGWIVAQRQEQEGKAGLDELLFEAKRRGVSPLIQDWLLP